MTIGNVCCSGRCGDRIDVALPANFFTEPILSRVSTMEVSTQTLTHRLKDEALRLGFDRVGVCQAVTPEGITRFGQWLDAGYAGQMHYLSDRRDAYHHPNSVLDGVRSVLLLAINYRTADPNPPAVGQGRVSRYAWGADYHNVLHDRLKSLSGWLRTAVPGAAVRGVVDTAPLLERELAQLAGLGWIGKNTLLLNRELGSWFFLAALLTDVELQYDQPHQTNHCGTCTACLDACPTDAFVEAYVLDSRKCISYLTIELKDAIPEPLRGGVGEWLFGCDVCQDVCPWNGRAPLAVEPSFEPAPHSNPIELTALFDLDDADFRERFRHTPFWRPRRRGILRNAAIVLGNRPTVAALPALIKGLGDAEPLVRAASAWALGRFESPAAIAALRCRRDEESDPDAAEEIAAALGDV